MQWLVLDEVARETGHEQVGRLPRGFTLAGVGRKYRGQLSLTLFLSSLFYQARYPPNRNAMTAFILRLCTDMSRSMNG